MASNGCFFVRSTDPTVDTVGTVGTDRIMSEVGGGGQKAAVDEGEKDEEVKVFVDAHHWNDSSLSLKSVDRALEKITRSYQVDNRH